MRRTKIVCTIGPVSSNEIIIGQLIDEGMDVVRLNFSHITHETAAEVIALVRRLAEERKKPIAILQDLQGPRLRVGTIEKGEVFLEPGSNFALTTRAVPGNEKEVFVEYAPLPNDVNIGDIILLDDGLLELVVESKTETDVVCQVSRGGILLPHKGMNLPGVSLSTPTITDKDRADMSFGIAQRVDFIALSFVRSAQDIREFKALLKSYNFQPPVIAKIEKPEAVDDFDNILAIADGIMVARGDLGIETSVEKVPILQKEMIRKARRLGKPIITATQMLESMIHNPRPTRAEASDVANAIFDGTDAVMLSGETAVGAFPVDTVRTMARIALTTEQSLPFENYIEETAAVVASNSTEAIAQATCEIAHELGAKAVITLTESGYTARMVAKYRPSTPILAVTPNEATRIGLTLVWGVMPYIAKRSLNTDEFIAEGVNLAREKGWVKDGDTVLITAGIPIGVPGRTNLLKVHTVGEEKSA